MDSDTAALLLKTRLDKTDPGDFLAEPNLFQDMKILMLSLCSEIRLNHIIPLLSASNSSKQAVKSVA